MFIDERFFLFVFVRALKTDGHDDWQQQNALNEKQTKLKSDIKQLEQVNVFDEYQLKIIIL